MMKRFAAALALMLHVNAVFALEPEGYDPLATVRVKTASDAEALRGDLIRFIWQQPAMPHAMPNMIEEEERPPLGLRTKPPGRTYGLTQRMEFGVTTHAHFVQAADPAGCLLIYHSGHGEPRTAVMRDGLLQRALDGGCDLILAAMPLMHDNPRPVVQTRFGPMWLRDHDAFVFLGSETFNPLKLFMQPLLAAVNHAAERRGAYRGIFMAGLSGGGWTTTLYAALDTRITASFPVAGSLPLALRTFSDARIGDWEQIGSGLHRHADYLDLYLLATHPGRTQVQLLNVRDPCCFGGRLSRLYDSQMTRLAAQWGGQFEVGLDEQTRAHDVTPQHSDAILGRIAALAGIRFPSAPGSPCRVWPEIELTSISALRGHAFGAGAPTLVDVSNGEGHPQRSPAIVCENGVELGPPHSLHEDIMKNGAGAFSHYGGGVVFSASDSSDPRSNGRRYTMVVPVSGDGRAQ